MFTNTQYLSASKPPQEPSKVQVQLKILQPKPDINLTLLKPQSGREDLLREQRFLFREKCEVETNFLVAVKDPDQQILAVILTNSFGHPLAGDGQPWFFGPPLQDMWFDSFPDKKLADLDVRAFDLLRRRGKVSNEVAQDVSRVFFQVTLLNELKINYAAGEVVAWTQTFCAPEISAALNQNQTNCLNAVEKITTSSFSDCQNGNASLVQEDNLCPNTQVSPLESEKAVQHGLIVAAHINFVQATEWLMYLTQERRKNKAAKVNLFFLVKDIDAAVQILEKTCNQGCKFSFSFGLKNPVLLLNFLKALFEIAREFKPVYVPSSNLVVAQYHDPHLAMSPVVRRVVNEVFFPTFYS